MRTTGPRETYLDTVFGADDPALTDVRRAMVINDEDRMSISPHEARLLQFLMRALRVRTVVEIGTLAGHSALAMAAALPPEGQLITIERDEARLAVARAFFATSLLSARIDARGGSALEVLAGLTGAYDMVFIDANKREYPLYLDWAEAHVRRGGLIVGDNTFLWGAVHGDSHRESATSARADAMREFNRRLADPTRYNSTLLPTAEGMTVAQKLF